MSYNIDAAATELEQGKAVFRRVLFDAYRAGTEDAKNHWCGYFAPCIDELALALQRHDPDLADQILEKFGIEFTDAKLN